MDLYIDAVDLLKKTTVTNRQIMKDLGLGQDWLVRLKRMDDTSPKDIGKIQCLHDYLLREHKHRMKQNRTCSERSAK